MSTSKSPESLVEVVEARTKSVVPAFVVDDEATDVVVELDVDVTPAVVVAPPVVVVDVLPQPTASRAMANTRTIARARAHALQPLFGFIFTSFLLLDNWSGSGGTNWREREGKGRCGLPWLSPPASRFR
jgi:hypothetical protein